MRSILTSALVAATVFAAPAHAEVEAVGESGFVSRHTVVVEATAEEAWGAIVEPSGWWNGAHSFSGDAENLTLDAHAGGCFCEVLPAGENRAVPGSVRHMEVLFADPGTAMRLSGALGPLQSEPLGGILTITLKPTGGGTRILFEYVVGGTMRFDAGQIGPAVDRVIGEQLGRLAASLGRAEPAPRAVVLPPSTAAEEIVDGAGTGADELQAPKELGADFLSDLDGRAPAQAPGSAEPQAVLDDFDTR